MNKNNFFFIFLIIFCNVNSIAAKEVLLFGDGDFDPVKFNKSVNRIKKGDTVLFSNGVRYKVREYLGGGKSSLVFALDKNWVIRIPAVSYRLSSIESTVNGYYTLQHFKIPSVTIELDEYVKNEFVIAKRVYIEKRGVKNENIELTLENYFSNYRQLKNTKLDEELIKFSSLAAHFKRFGDFYSTSQLVWDGEKWILLDWDQSHLLLGNSYEDKVHPFLDVRDQMPRSIYKKVRDNILEARSQKEFQDKNQKLLDSYKLNTLNESKSCSDFLVNIAKLI